METDHESTAEWATNPDGPPSDVLGQDGKFHSILPLDLMLACIDSIGESILARNADNALYVLASLRERLLQDSALYERIYAEQSGASVRH